MRRAIAGSRNAGANADRGSRASRRTWPPARAGRAWNGGFGSQRATHRHKAWLGQPWTSVASVVFRSVFTARIPATNHTHVRKPKCNGSNLGRGARTAHPNRGRCPRSRRSYSQRRLRGCRSECANRHRATDGLLIVTRDDQIAEICRLVENRAGLGFGSVGPLTSINMELGFDGADLFEIIEAASSLLGTKPTPPFDFNVFNAERSPVAVAIYSPVAKLLSRLMPNRFAPPISPTTPVASLTPERLRDILAAAP